MQDTRTGGNEAVTLAVCMCLLPRKLARNELQSLQSHVFRACLALKNFKYSIYEINLREKKRKYKTDSVMITTAITMLKKDAAVVQS